VAKRVSFLPSFFLCPGMKEKSGLIPEKWKISKKWMDFA